MEEDLTEEIKSAGICGMEQSAPSEDAIPGLSKSDLEAEKSPQKRLRGRKRKVEQLGEKGGVHPSKLSPSLTEKKRVFKVTEGAGRRKVSLPASSSAKRSRRKMVPSKGAVNYDLNANKQEIEAENLDDSRLSGVKSSVMLEGDDDEDTMAASVAPTEVDEESVTATTTTTTEETTEVLLKRPRPPPRLRASRPKKKKKYVSLEILPSDGTKFQLDNFCRLSRSLKSLMRKKRRGTYHYGDESDGSDSDDDGVGSSSRATLHTVASSRSINSKFGDENSLDASVGFLFISLKYGGDLLIARFFRLDGRADEGRIERGIPSTVSILAYRTMVTVKEVIQLMHLTMRLWRVLEEDL